MRAREHSGYGFSFVLSLAICRGCNCMRVGYQDFGCEMFGWHKHLQFACGGPSCCCRIFRRISVYLFFVRCLVGTSHRKSSVLPGASG